MTIKLVAAPTLEPVTVTELARNLRLLLAPTQDYDGAEVDLLASLITAAREDVENYTQRDYALKTYSEAFAGLAAPLPLVHSVAEVVSVTYLDTSDTVQIIAPTDYYTVTVKERGCIEFKSSFVVPDVSSHPEAITVTYRSGLSDASLVPQTIKQSIVLIASHWYENREAASVTGIEIKEVPLAYRWLLDAHRLPALG